MRRPPLHRALVALVKTYNRNPWTHDYMGFVTRGDGPAYSEDGIWTYHGHSFVDDPRFDRAYRCAMATSGADFKIKWRTHTLLWAASHAAQLDGDFVECGTARGFMASAICDYLDWTDRPFYLFDTFEADPRWPDQYANGAEAVAANFAQWPGAHLVVGRIPGSLVSIDIDQVAYLHVDLNGADAEEAAVRHFWPKLVSGGVLIYDDYGFQGFEESRVGADRLAAELGYSVLTLPTGQGLAIKR